MTATDRLRAMLDERKVEWEALSDQQEGDFTITATRWHDGEGGLLTMFISEPHGSTWDFFWLPTPEQAVAATLGTVEYRKPTTLSQLEAENAKLRELCKDMMAFVEDDDACERCGHDAECVEAADGELVLPYEGQCLMLDLFADRMCELGIEVDE